MAEDRVIVVLLQPHGSHNAGERVSLQPQAARDLVTRGIAERPGMMDRASRAVRGDPDAPIRKGDRVKFFLRGHGDQVGEVEAAPREPKPLSVRVGDQVHEVAREDAVRLPSRGEAPARDSDGPTGEPAPPAELSREEQIAAAVAKVPESDGDAWTQEGRPTVAAVREISGLDDVSAEEVATACDALWGGD